MRRNRLLAIVLVLVAICVCVLGACKKPEEEQEVLTQRMQNFVDAVDAIETPITLNSGAAIDTAYDAYAFLDQYERDSRTVKQYKTTLDGYQNQYTALKNANSNEPVDEQEQLKTNFCAAVDALPALDELTLQHRATINSALAIYNRLDADSKRNANVVAAYQKLQQANARVIELEQLAQREEWLQLADEFIRAVYYGIGEITKDSYIIEDLLYEYDNFPIEVKTIGGMKEAKALLDEKYAEYLVVRDEYDIEEFVSAVRKIGKDGVTLSSEGSILKAENLYKFMSENAKQDSSVVSSYKKLCEFREQFDVLFAIAERERIEYFIQLANNLPTDLDNIDMSWYWILDEVSDAYWALTYDSQQLPEVEEAFEIWDRVQTAFDKKGYRKIPNFNINIDFSGDTVPFLLLNGIDESIASIRNFYGVTTNAQLQQYAALYVDVYVDGEYIAKMEIDLDSLFNKYILKEVNKLLQALSVDNPAITSGANFSFAAHIEDREQTYIPTAQTKMSGVCNYTW